MTRFALDAQFHWQGNDAAIEAWIASGWLARDACGGLQPADSRGRAAWLDAKRRVLETGNRAVAFVLHGPDGRMAVASLQPDGGGGYGLRVSAAQPSRHAALAPHLQPAFGMTPAEVRLALALHMLGDLALAAAEAGISCASARRRLQDVFDKTGVHRQIDLIRLLDAMARVLG